MASPTTFNTRPRICGPTGMVTGRPVETTFMPLCNPSVLSMAMVRTVSSPMCCCTSTMSVRPSARRIFRASCMLGRLSLSLFSLRSK